MDASPVGSADAKMHTPRHRRRTIEVAIGLTDYKESTCNHSTTRRGHADKADE
jgi:hypothetical protein